MTETDTESTTSNPISQVIYLITSLIILVILLRFVFLLIGLSGGGFVNWVYQVSSIFVQPFYGIFGQTFTSGSSGLEIESIVAMIVVAVVGGILARLLRSIG